MRLLLGIILLVLALAAPAAAGDYGPAIPKATGEPHPEGNEYMRKWHMTMMRHDRDLTMYDGEREVNASLGECFDCHTVKDQAGVPVTAADDRHFCRVCHDFTAVRVDCFDCHRSTPGDFQEPDLHARFRDVIDTDGVRTDPIELTQAWLDALPQAEASE